ncbi:MAG: hypothetical protein ACRDMJ_07790 [Solirubrobacteraceae bacterium]
MLRAGLLDNRRIVILDAGGIGARLAELGATIEPLGAETLADEQAAAAWAAERAPLHALVVDLRVVFGDGDGDGDGGGAGPLQATLDLAWRATRAVATGAMIEQPDAARLVLVAPRPDAAADHAEAVRAALENLARTLSVEWARFQISATAIMPGAITAQADIAELVAYVVSPAGGYLSGCRLELGAVTAAGPAVA